MQEIIAFIQQTLNTITNFSIGGFPVYVILTLVFGLLVLRWVINKLV